MFFKKYFRKDMAIKIKHHKFNFDRTALFAWRVTFCVQKTKECHFYYMFENITYITFVKNTTSTHYILGYIA